MAAFAIRFGAGRAVRYLTLPDTVGEHAKGWRPFIWAKDIQRAELFSSEESAGAYAREHLGHDRWAVVVAPSRGIPTDDLGGSPVAMRMAA
ncbi:hypothetical protein [Methylobacterium haplocladii]|uniref:Uncharacterized protein n=1 Tax=Methylobacterium haplocladii TaxID=1176176 RepID=A0A512IS65_9HYPH|nr:hypothetical protein [Methylobacterium haplocladii]GEP00531.1 hypothetical protein MHA02_29180 [Methylobacterium haplocladii]GJD85446.1 hypothetical protein HPGCJGGD_3335 [Methylobacterium haplocladii]GLS57831.1 hypothetical protein GCM10007887_04870 [Methylobacterium haplocladii]